MKKRLVLIIALVGAVVCSVVRYFQIVSLTDFETGFFLPGSELGGALIYVLLVAFSVLLTVMAFIGRKNGDDAYFLASDGMGSNATRFLGATELAAAVFLGSRLLNIRETSGAESMLDSLLGAGESAGGDSVIMVIMNVIGAAALLVSGFVLVSRIIPPPFTGYLKIAVTIYMFFRTTGYFGTDLLMKKHAEHMIVMMSYLMFTLFLLIVGRFYSRVETKNSRLGEVAFAALTFLWSATHVFSDLLAMISSDSRIHGFVSLNTEACAALIMSAGFLGVIFFTERKKDIIPLVEEGNA